MAAANRANRLTKLVSDLKKRYKPAPPTTRPLFETLVFATLLEHSLPDAAAKALAELQSGYYDWNEVRVSTRAELAERAKSLNDPLETADRLKRTLQSVFETIYGFDLEALKKQNLGVAVKQISGFDGVTPFAVNYVTQHALAGHAIAVNSGVMIALLAMDIVTEAEAKKGVVPGLERAIPKNKGVEAQAVLHELGVEVAKNPYGPAARKLLTDIDPSCKDRLPKRPKVEEPAPPAAEKPSLPTPSKGPAPASKEAAAASKDGAAKKPAPGKDVPAPAAKKPVEVAKPSPAPSNKAPAPASKAPAPANKAAEAKKPESKAPAAKAQPAAVKKPDAKKPETGKKPEAKKPEAKKPEPKKPEAKKPAAAPPKKPAPAKAAPPKKPATASKPAAPAAKKDAKKAPVPPAGKKGAAKKAADKKPAKRKPK